MEVITVFYQAEGARETAFLELEDASTIRTFKDVLKSRYGFDESITIFAEDGSEAILETVLIREIGPASGFKFHAHKCRHIDIVVTYNMRQGEGRFAPSTTIARLEKWAAIDVYGMSPEDAGEHVLQLKGTHDQPLPGVHIGSLTERGVCRLAFDLVPKERVNGFDAHPWS